MFVESNIFSCGVVGGKEKENGGRTGVRGGGSALERGARAGSHPCRKDITLFAPIVPPSAETPKRYHSLSFCDCPNQ